MGHIPFKGLSLATIATFFVFIWVSSAPKTEGKPDQ